MDALGRRESPQPLFAKIKARPAPLVLTSLALISVGLISLGGVKNRWMKATLLVGTAIPAVSYLFSTYSSLASSRGHQPDGNGYIAPTPAAHRSPPKKLTRGEEFDKMVENSGLSNEAISELKNCYVKKSPNLRLQYLNEIPDCIFQFTWLEELYIGYGQFKSLPSEISNLKNLKLIDARNGKLEDIPKEIGALENIEKIYLDYNYSLSSIPKEIEDLKKLHTLQLSRCNISGLSFDMNQLPQLRRFILADNPIQALPKINADSNLKEIDISGTEIHSLDFLEDLEDISVTYSGEINDNEKIKKKTSYYRSNFVLKNIGHHEQKVYQKNGEIFHELTDDERKLLAQWNFADLIKKTESHNKKSLYAFFDMLKSDRRCLASVCKTAHVSHDNAIRYVTELRQSNFDQSQFDPSRVLPQVIRIATS